MIVEIKGDKTLGEASVMIETDQEKEAWHQEEMVAESYDSPNVNLGTRSRSISRVTTNRDRIGCFRCRQYDHFTNECPNMGTDDSDGCESDGASLQLMTTEADIHDNFDFARFNEEVDYLNL